MKVSKVFDTLTVKADCDSDKLCRTSLNILERNEQKVNNIKKMIYVSKVNQKEKYYRPQ